MTTAAELMRQGRVKELWQMCCGFTNLSVEQFMDIQGDLLKEQITLLSRCELGSKLLRGATPTSIEEFRAKVPLTTYEDYSPYLSIKQEDVLPAQPLYWLHTSGRSSGGVRYKWVPYPERLVDAGTKVMMGSIIFSSCRGRGDIPIEEHDKFLYAMAPPPYGTGHLPYALARELNVDFLPAPEKAEGMSFQERVQEGFELALREGLDYFFGVSSVLVRIGEQFSHRTREKKPLPSLLDPRVSLRLMRGFLLSKLAHRNILPKDLWKVKGIVTAGMDTAIYKNRIKALWGRYPLEFYGATEISFIATQAWDFQGMTFVPDTAFLEFIPGDESLKSRNTPGYQPRTVLLHEVEAGKKYELVATSFHGGIFVRYRVGDMFKVISLRNDGLGIDTPQVVFDSRCGETVDLSGFAQLTEKTIWQAVMDSGATDENWVARKEVIEDEGILHLYVEPKESDQDAKNIADRVHEELKQLDPFYREIEEILGLKPVQVTLLTPGTFQQYTLNKLAAGADLAQLKPPHVKPSQDVMDELLQISARLREAS